MYVSSMTAELSNSSFINYNNGEIDCKSLPCRRVHSKEIAIVIEKILIGICTVNKVSNDENQAP